MGPLLPEVNDRLLEVAIKWFTYRKAGRRPNKATKVMHESTKTAIASFLIAPIVTYDKSFLDRYISVMERLMVFPWLIVLIN